MKAKRGKFFIAAAVLFFTIISAAQAQADTTTTIPITDTDWSALGSGMNNTVWTLAVDGSHNLYAGGLFTTAGGVSANDIAKWNGSSWSALGTGMNGSVKALAFDASGNLYAGGFFATAGGVTVNYVAKWNGTSWSALGTGMSAAVRALAFDGSGNLYAGGDFTTAGGVTANRIAKWDGTSWSALGAGVGGISYPCVYALAFDGSGNLYAGGDFTTAGGVAANHIAKWDGSSWSALSTGMNLVVYALAFDGSGNLYAGGYLTTAGGVSANYIAKWDGSSWSALGSGMGGVLYPKVLSLICDSSGNLYAGGYFTAAGGVSANYIAKWDGSSWSALGSGIQRNNVDALAVDNSTNLYAGGEFMAAGNKASFYIARCNISGVETTTTTTICSGTMGWTKMSTGTTDDLLGIWGASGSDIFVIGYDILHYNGTSWSSMPGSPTNLVGIWGSSSSDIFVAGNKMTFSPFTIHGSIDHYNGTSWSNYTTAGWMSLTSIWGYSSGHVIAVGYSGAWLFCDVSTCSNATPLYNADFMGVWALGPDYFAVGSSYPPPNRPGVFLPPWTELPTAAPYGVWGAFAGDVFAVGDYGTIAHYNGTSWSAMTSATGNNLRGVWGSSGSDVFAVGEGGSIVHYNGASWSVMTSGTAQNLKGIWGSAGNDVYVAGDNGTILHYNCITTTSTTTTCPAPDLSAPSGTGVVPLPAFSWQKVDGVIWYNVAVYSGAANKYAATKWFDASLVCATDNCSAQLAAALYPGQYWWWLNTWSDGPCGFMVQPGGKYKQFTVTGCAGPALTGPTGTVASGTRPAHTFTSNAEWVDLQIYSSTLGAVSSQWADASTACTMGSCSVTPVRWIMALGQNWWWVNTYSTQCGYQFQPGGNLGSYIVQ